MMITAIEVERFLRDSLGRAARDVEPVGQGEWSQAFFFRDGPAERVIRFSAIDDDFRLDRFAAGFASERLPIPRIETIGQAFGGYFAVSERVRGTMIDDLDAAGMRRTIPAIMRMFDALRSVDTSRTSGYGPWDSAGNGTAAGWREYLLAVSADDPSSRTHGWRDRLAAGPIGLAPFDSAYRRLAALVPACPEQRRVIHSDLLHFNLLVDDGEIVAIIDWGCGKYGDWLYDLAWFIFWQPWYQSMSGIDLAAEARRYIEIPATEAADFARRLLSYQLHIGLDSLAYCAFKGHWDDARWITDRFETLV